MKPSVAYFCMEYGLASHFKTYSGGLGILAGDMLKAAKDLKAPLVAIGLRWKQGYTEQRIGKDGKPYDCYHNFEYDFLEDTGVKVSVKIRQNNVFAKVWKVEKFNNATLYLLDTDIPENTDRWITGQLYGWFSEERIAQEMILGIGGVKALRKLGHKVDVYHFNEGHAVLAGLELMREKMETGKSFENAWQETKNQIVFTTHTPIKEGNESHNHEVLQYMGANLGLSVDQMHKLGGTPFNMTVAALRIARKSNAVAQLHKDTANDMWKEVEGRSEIIGITNGVHRGTWVDDAMAKAKSPDDLWNRHTQLKSELITFIKERNGVTLNPDILTIGFSRRAAPYKRSDLLFSNAEKARELFKNKKLQIVFSGKAHPLDDTGKGIVTNLVKMSREFPESVVFLENYDMDIGSALTRGTDVWLNNPRRPLEACGTSGMKAAMNGVLNLSILDGWWPEACNHGVNGWAIGDDKVPATTEEQDARDGKALYDVLFNEVIPTYYNDKAKWKNMMKESISSTETKFSAEEMVNQYYSKLYV